MLTKMLSFLLAFWTVDVALALGIGCGVLWLAILERLELRELPHA